MRYHDDFFEFRKAATLIAIADTLDATARQVAAIRPCRDCDTDCDVDHYRMAMERLSLRIRNRAHQVHADSWQGYKRSIDEMIEEEIEFGLEEKIKNKGKNDD